MGVADIGGEEFEDTAGRAGVPREQPRQLDAGAWHKSQRLRCLHLGYPKRPGSGIAGRQGQGSRRRGMLSLTVGRGKEDKAQASTDRIENDTVAYESGS